MRRLAVLLLLAFPASAPAAASDITLVSSKALSPRLTELQLRTAAVTGNTGVRVLLPAGYDPRGRERYPVIYLLHGALGDYTSWTAQGDAEKLTAAFDGIVVMPTSGAGEGYNDWYNGGAFGPPAWETYHVGQLVPWIDAHYPTRATRSGRALVGLSMGGYGAMEYAARHPDMFAAAAGFSPAVDITDPTLILINSVSEAGGMGAYGDYASQEIRWHGRNPADLAENLRGVRITLRTGNGLPGGRFGGALDPTEMTVHTEVTTLHNRLTAYGIPHTFEDYGAGAHTWPYWQRDFRMTLPWIEDTFAHPAPAPSPFTYRSIEPAYSVYGWTVKVRRPALEFSALRDAGPQGFTLSGSGSATVTTGRLFAAGARVRARVASSTGLTTQRATATRSGRITLGVELGPANRYQQDSPKARLSGSGTTVYSTRVTFDVLKKARAKAKRHA